MIFCEKTIEAGTMAEIRVPAAGGGILDAVVIAGKNEGKTLVITAGVHGCEYVGIEAVRRFLKQIRPEELSGNLIVLPLVNPNGFYQGTKQIMPEDQENLNRMFPGSADGTFSQRIAHAIETYIYPHADFLMDLHGGDVNEAMHPLAFYPAAGAEAVNRAALEAARQLSVCCLVRSTARNGLYSWAVQKGIPALLVERGGSGRWTEEEVNACQEDIFRIMSHLGICKGGYKPEHPAEICEAVYEEAESDGFWYPEITAGQKIRKGGKLGTLRDAAGKKEQEITAKFDGIVLYYTTALGVRSGDPLAAYGRE